MRTVRHNLTVVVARVVGWDATVRAAPAGLVRRMAQRRTVGNTLPEGVDREFAIRFRVDPETAARQITGPLRAALVAGRVPPEWSIVRDELLCTSNGWTAPERILQEIAPIILLVGLLRAAARPGMA
jgi:hypothetical protein